MAQACGLTPEDARAELKRLGYILARNNHDPGIWMMPGNEQTNEA